MGLDIFKKSKDQKNVEKILGRLDNETALVKEADEDYKINLYIRERYSLSKELSLHRKKILGIVDETEWQEYVAYVNECIEKARESEL